MVLKNIDRISKTIDTLLLKQTVKKCILLILFYNLQNLLSVK